MATVRKDNLIEPELSYRVMGILFDVKDRLGFGHRENVYQRAVRVGLEEAGLTFEEQVRVPLRYHGKEIATKVLDFLIEKRVVLELKATSSFRKQDYEQVKDYLVSANLPLAILARFGPEGVVYRRILRPQGS